MKKNPTTILIQLLRKKIKKNRYNEKKKKRNLTLM
jgi:hypothetical protein